MDYVGPADVLFREPVLAHSSASSVAGHRVTLQTNSHTVLAMFQDAFGGRCERITGDAVAEGASSSGHPAPVELLVQVVVHDDSPDGADLRAVRHICPDAFRVLIHGAGGMAVSDPLRREALVYASDALVRDTTFFRQSYLEAAILALATHFDRQPVHAACIGMSGRAALLVGPSGSGKSTVSYAAQSAGFTVFSEDMVWVQLEPALTVWARSGAIRLLPEAQEHFPELRSESVTLQPNGKQKICMRPAHTQRTKAIPGEDVVVCLLRRGSAAARLDRVKSDTVYAALTQDRAAGFDRYPERGSECSRALATDRGWRLTLSTDPRDAVQLLSALLRGESV